ncbi:MAG TPA: hypothetical protein VGV59_20695 [Pyrinomonadaceae bacterium]|nr:hypothetical protein [Pyrinomonadaceae bacterium]
MTTPSADRRADESADAPDVRGLRARYVALTVAVCLPLLVSFVLLKSTYPVTAWTMMTGGQRQAFTYYRLSGETQTGETVEVRASELTDALSSLNWGMVAFVDANASFKIRRPHLDNAKLSELFGGVERLPRGIRMSALLRAWGAIYNSRLPAQDGRRLKALRVDAFEWDGQRYGDYDKLIETWRVEL